MPHAFQTILPAAPTGNLVLAESASMARAKQRKLPPGIVPLDIKEPSKSIEILSNSRLLNQSLVDIKLL